MILEKGKKKLATMNDILYFSVMVTQEIMSLTQHDRNVINDIVSHYAPGDRVKALRFIFKFECSFEHYIYLGQVVGAELQKKISKEMTGKVFRMETLRLLN